MHNAAYATSCSCKTTCCAVASVATVDLARAQRTHRHCNRVHRVQANLQPCCAACVRVGASAHDG
eukprot:1143655-Pelagomonas_calceolata.AAC.13